MKSRIRLNKYLALCGLGSRRKVEEFISSGRIKINGIVNTALQRMVDTGGETVEFDDKIINPPDELFYIMMNKPAGYITTMSDDRGRPTVMDLLPAKYKKAKLFPVGRLDRDSEGLLLFTNDGILAYNLTHPKFGILKEYIVELDRPLAEKDRRRIEGGVILNGKKTNQAEIVFPLPERNVVNIVISEGKKRQIRLTFKKFNYRVRALKRIALGPLRLGGLQTGASRPLAKDEIEELMSALTAMTHSLRPRTLT